MNYFHHELQNAMELAVRYHAGANRKRPRGGMFLPYVVHPFEVFKLVWVWGAGDHLTSQAALLHDVLEDTSVDAGCLRHAGVADNVISIVEELTCRDDSEKSAYLLSFADSQTKSVQALVVKLADRICNTRDFALTDRSYAREYLEKANCLFGALSSRRREIEREWGEVVWMRILQDWTTVKKKVGVS